MAKIREARGGESLTIKSQLIPFSLWPTARNTRRYRIQRQLFAADPWPIISNAIEEKCPKPVRPAARAFRAQAEDFYQAAQHSRVMNAKPLLLYYCMLNLAKAFVLTRGAGSKEYKPHHGLSENAKLRQIEGAGIVAYPSTNRPQAFADFLSALSGQVMPQKITYRLGDVLPQIVTGHRLWCAAAQARERFVGVHSLRFLTDGNKSLWIQILISRNDLMPLHVTHRDLIAGCGLGSNWRVCRGADANMWYLEKKVADKYTHRPSDQLMTVSDGIRSLLWSTVLIVPPYKKYYLYASPLNRRAQVVPQVLSMYLVMFFLGSITRYRPHHFDRLLDSVYGAQIEGVLNDVPTQFLYLLASEFLRRDVVKAAIA